MQRRRIYIASVLDTATGQTDILSFVWTTYWLPKTGFGNYSHQDSNWSILFCVLKFQSDFLTCINSHHFSEAAAFRALFKLDWRRWYWWRYAKADLPRGWHKRHCVRGEKMEDGAEVFKNRTDLWAARIFGLPVPKVYRKNNGSSREVGAETYVVSCREENDMTL